MNSDFTFCSPGCDRLGCYRNIKNMPPGTYSVAQMRGTEYCPNCCKHYKHIEPLEKYVTAEFAKVFVDNLVSTYVDRTESEVIDSAGTIGWFNVFRKTCHDQGIPELVMYEDALEWDESDWFVYELTQLCFGITKYGFHF